MTVCQILDEVTSLWEVLHEGTQVSIWYVDVQVKYLRFSLKGERETYKRLLVTVFHLIILFSVSVNNTSTPRSVSLKSERSPQVFEYMVGRFFPILSTLFS